MEDPILGIVAPHPPIIVSEVGGERARVTAGTVRALESCASVLAEYAPETLVLMSPHAPVVRDGFLIDDSERTSGDLGAFGARSVAINAHGDPALAREVLDRDRELDEEFASALRQVMSFVIEDQQFLRPTVDTVFALKGLERIGDHAKNVAEQVLYMVEGERPRKQKKGG